jgi:hypothetical protein
MIQTQKDVGRFFFSAPYMFGIVLYSSNFSDNTVGVDRMQDTEQIAQLKW